ncbi:MAG: carbonic anhydrase [Verrucomicrobiales bacterium]|nr:carbonic anhydrase [Verrucomicrobiales bacterium]
MTPAHQALERLREGNRRFVSDSTASTARIGEARRNEVASSQAPFAIVLGCSDSRVPVESIFDAGLGDIFTVRVAGNVATPAQIGSIEFAAANFGSRLVVVLGHSGCGAIRATIDVVKQQSDPGSPGLNAIVDQIRPAVEDLLNSGVPTGDSDELMEKATRLNVRSSANHLRKESAILRDLISRENLLVVGAEYSLASGEVEFFDGVPNG